MGINNFLDGFLPSENVRFRQKAFRFETTTTTDDMVLDLPVARYSMLSKTFPSFRLKIANGQVRKGEVVGIVGANALGKTTFMKMLAGVDKPDSGNLQIGAKISYKPQYLNQDLMDQLNQFFQSLTRTKSRDPLLRNKFWLQLD